MPEEYTRVGPLRQPHSLREIEPVTPYPRINPQQHKSEDQRRYDRDRSKKNKSRRRRRFTAMRRLVGQMKGRVRFKRVDYTTAEREMRENGLKLAEDHLITLLLQLKFPLQGIDLLFQRLRETPPQSALTAGRRLAADNRQILPESPEGLLEFNLVLQQLHLEPSQQNIQMHESLEKNDRFSYEWERLRLIFSRADRQLELTVSILVGAAEIDDGGRRVIIYQRPDHSYALYADKPISLSI